MPWRKKPGSQKWEFVVDHRELTVLDPSSLGSIGCATHKYFSSEQKVWVQVGSLFLSLYESGNTTFAPILALCAAKGRQVVVVAGRHGLPLGGRMNGDGTFVTRPADDPHDAANPEGDQETITKLCKEHTNLDCSLFDVEKFQPRTLRALREYIEAQLRDGKVVILNWCFSLCAMNPGFVAVDQFNNTTVADRVANDREKCRPVRELVDRHWAFAREFRDFDVTPEVLLRCGECPSCTGDSLWSRVVSSDPAATSRCATCGTVMPSALLIAHLRTGPIPCRTPIAPHEGVCSICGAVLPQDQLRFHERTAHRK